MSGFAGTVPEAPPRGRPALAHAAPVRLPRGVCPLLEVASGRWRHAGPSRDHRCTALRPAAPLAHDKQVRLCLVAAHVTCPSYLAAHDARARWGTDMTPPGEWDQVRTSAGDAGARRDQIANRWDLVRVAPVVAAPGRGPSLGDMLRHRSAVRVGLVGLLVVAFAAIIGSRPPSESGSGALLVPTASAAATPTPVPTPVPTLAATPAALLTAAPTAIPTVTITVAPTTPAPFVYIVVAGDTLSAIAGRFGTTVQALMDANALTTTNLRVGQQLQIPQRPPTVAPSLGFAP